MNRRRRALGWICTGFISSAAFQACGSDSGNGGPPSMAGSLSGTAGTAQNDGMVVDPPGSAGAGGESPFDPLCGVTDESCIPDDEDSCSPTRAGSGAGGRAGTGGVGGAGGRGGGTTAGLAGTAGGGGGSAGASAAGGDEGGHGGMSGGAGEGGQSAVSAGGSLVSGGQGGESGASDAGGESGVGQAAGAGAPGDGTAGAGQGGESAGGSGVGAGGSTTVVVQRSCQVVLREQGEERHPRAVCAPSGRGETSSGCFSSADCEAGLACVGDASPGQCRPYCCTGDSACNEADTHCTEQYLVSPTSRPLVPVCMPATNCNLAEEYPCPEGATCTCAPDTACMVVTSNGKTSCVPKTALPGDDEGKVGQPCPCAWGHVCSPETDRCVKLCQPAAPGDACDGTRCQFATDLPPGWGTCLTTSAEAG